MEDLSGKYSYPVSVSSEHVERRVEKIPIQYLCQVSMLNAKNGETR